MKFSKRTNWGRAPNKLAKLVTSLKAKGEAILNLTESNPTRCEFKYLNASLFNPLTEPRNLIYDPDPHGLLETRLALCRYYADEGISLAPEQIFLTASTSEAYSFVFRLVANAGDSLLAPQPSYPILDYLAQLHDLALHRYALTRSHGAWHISLPDLQKKITPDSRAILVVHPNNPTGNYVQPSERASLIELAQSHSFALIADEVFFDFPLRKDEEVQSFAATREALTFTLSGISKVLGLPQMKLSWIVVTGPEGPRREAIARLEIISDTYLSVSTPVQHAASRWFELRPKIQQEIRERLSANRDFFLEKLRGQRRIQALPPEGGWSIGLAFAESRTDEAWAELLLSKEKVLLHPGYLFDFEEGSFLIASLLLPPAVFQEGVSRILRIFSE